MKPFELFKIIRDGKYKKAGEDLDWTVKIMEDKIYLLFQQTTSKYDWRFVNFGFGTKVYKHQENTLYVYKGFAKSYRSANDLVMKDVLKAIKENPEKDVIVAGYSLGGAMAVLAAEDIHFRTGKKVKEIITFGAPCVSAFWSFKTRRYLRECAEKITQYAIVCDIVPFCPPFFMRLVERTKIGKFQFKNMFKVAKNHSDYDIESYYEVIK